MICLSDAKRVTACSAFAILVSVLSGCGAGGGAAFQLFPPGNGTLPSSGVSSPPSEPRLPVSVTAAPDGSTVHGDEPGSRGALAAATGTPATAAPTTPTPRRRSMAHAGAAPGGIAADASAAPEESSAATTATPAGTMAGSRRLAEWPRNNPQAADLLDHWGGRQSDRIKEALSLAALDAEANAADLQALRTAAQADDEALAPDLHDSDEVQVLGTGRDVTYGRWAGGYGDTLSIEFNLSRAAPEMRDNPVFRAMLERAGKAWSRRIADTWTPWERSAGEVKGWLAGSKSAIQVRVEAGGETSTGLEIYVTLGNLPGNTAGQATQNTVHSLGNAWQPHFGSIEIDSEHFREAGEAELSATLAHEIGHVLGAWMGGTVADRYVSYTDTAAGTWSGPNVVAVHGGPAPFQDASDPLAWVDGERDPDASQFDLGHSGVCASLLSYCRQNAALPAFLPQPIDFAFLADLGMTATEETDRPETYGLAGWTEYAAFTLSLSRELEIALADPQPHYDGAVNPWHKLEVTDLLQAAVDAFGYRSTGTLSSSMQAAGVSGTARYAGGLIGAALDLEGLPSVTGNASLSLDLNALDGTASFTSLLVYPDGLAQTFADGALHYPFGLSDNAIVGSGTDSTLQADFYGPGHEDVAGVLHDPNVGLLASFGATTDDRPSREDVVAAADYLAGMAYQRGSANSADDGWYRYRCETDVACESRHAAPSADWTDWTGTTRDAVLGATAGWEARNVARPDTGRGFVRIARQTSADTDGGRGRHVVDGYTGTLEKGAFGAGFEQYTDEWTDENGTSPGSGNQWAGFQGTLSGSLPGGLARWSGPMLGFQSGQDAGANPFVEGLATVKFSLSDNLVDVLFTEVASRDDPRTVPDFGFEDLQAEADGTFGGFQSGSIEGAFLGSTHEEAAGWFQHNLTHVIGSFGAQRLPDTVTLEESGAARLLNAGFYAFEDWGFWGIQFHEEVFRAFIEQRTETAGGTTTYYSPSGRIEGTLSGSNPVSGTAVWTGEVRAYDTQSDGDWAPISGNARLAVDFDDSTVDVDLTAFEGGHGDMSWRSLQLRSGSFRHSQGQATIEGAFYGATHQGAAGKFNRDSLRGVFGAVRN